MTSASLAYGRSKTITSKPYQQLRDRMSPESRARTQERLAGLLKVNQAAISKLEGRTDMDISTLRSYIEAMGEDLDIVARFPEGDVHIQKFHQEEANGAEA